MSKQLQIRNSTAEFLIFQAEDKAQGVQVFYQDETIWASQKAIAALFDVDRSVITKHLKNIFETGELLQESVCAKFAHTAEDVVCRKFRHTTQHGAIEKYRVIQDRLFESDFDKFTLPTLPFEDQED